MSPALTNTTEQRDELENVLRSGIFGRAPNLANFLIYICERYFLGDSDSIKEYSIAVEALRRPVDFDQRRDSIVRVEAHRLRKRLAEYYRSSGADHAIQIEIPNGQYAPRFVYNQSVQTVVPAVPAVFAPAIEPAADRSLQGASWQRGSSWWLRSRFLFFGLLALLAVTIALSPRYRAAPSNRGEVWNGSYAEPVPSEFRFLPGYHGRPFTDRQGRLWQPDAYFAGGVSAAIPQEWPIDGLPDPKFVKSRREGNFTYTIPERQGSYEVHLHFIGLKPLDPTDPSTLSTFNVLVNNKTVLDSFDPISDGGGFDRYHTRVIRDVSPLSDGKIHLAFAPIAGVSFVSAIEVLSSEPGKIRPVRIVAAKSSVIDSDGLVWEADEDAVGGFLVERNDSIRDPRLRMLFVSEHYGNFAYHIPVPPGKYRVKLYFAETFFGSKLPFASPAPGARVFNLFADGVALLRDFDVANEAGGANRALVKQFDDIQPNAQGNIVLEFVPLRNYAEVNAIEVSQMN